MARRITIEFIGRDQSASKTASDVEKRFGKLGSKMDAIGQKAGRVLAGGLLIGGAAAVKMGQKASDLAETTSKASQIFGGEAVPALEKFAGAAAKNLGQSKQTALDAASTFGVFGKSAGLAGKDLVGFSTEMTTLASDMASFNNTSPEEAIEAIGAALRGESEPIRKYGVLLDDATLRNEAMRLGLVKTTKEALTPQQKVLAAQAAILKQTADQQGDFARTSDGLANKQRILKAQLENLGTEIGAKVLPAMVKLSEVGLKMIGWVDRNRVLVGTLVAVVGGLTAAVWAVSAAMKAWIVITKVWRAVTIVARNAQLAFNLVLMANPIGLVIAAIAALVAIFVVAYKKSETFRKVVDKSWAGIKRATAAVWGWMKSFTASTWKAVQNYIVNPIKRAWAAVSSAWKSIQNGTRAAWNGVKSIVRDGISSVVGFVRDLPGRIRSLAGSFASAGRAIIGAFVDGLKNAAGVVSGIAGNVWSAVRSMLNGAISRINSALEFTIRLPGPDLTINPPNIPYLAKGGIVTRPTLAVIGEAGPEAVVPLSGANARKAGVGAGQPVEENITVVLQLDGREIHRSLVKRKRALGTTLGLA